LNVAYLINQYPKISHTFIRSEIQALESAGVSVTRIAIRPGPEALITEEDLQEEKKTHYILRTGVLHLVSQFLILCIQKPLRTLALMKCYLQLTKNARGAFLKHMAYAIEAVEVVRLCETLGVSHLHSHFGTNGTTTALFSRILGGPQYSFTVHGPDEFDNPVRLSLGKKVEHATSVIAISQYGRSQLYRWCRYDDWSKIHIVHCTVAPKFLQRDTKSHTEPGRLLSVGRICEQKGQLIIVQAVKKLVERGICIKLRLIGDGEMRAIIEHEIARLNLNAHIEILGWQGEDKIIQELDNAELFILPSFAEGLPVAIMEALAREVPVISTYVAGIPELVKSRKTGWLVHAGDPETLANCIADALKASMPVKQKLGRIGKRQVIAEFGPEEPMKLINLFAGEKLLNETVVNSSCETAARTPGGAVLERLS